MDDTKRKTFIIEIQNVTTHPHYAATTLFRVKEQRETKGRRHEFWRKGREMRGGSEGLFLFGCFGRPNSFFQEVKSNQKSLSYPIMYFTLILSRGRGRTHGRKRQRGQR